MITATGRSILKFTLRAFLLVMSVVIPFVIYYVYLDPFKVLRQYDQYFENPRTQPKRIGINKGMVTVRTYLLNSDTVSAQYNAFIFGSSISCFYDAYEWRDLLASRDSARSDIHPFHFDSSSESPASMARKVEFLKRRGAPVEYALVILDPIILGVGDDTSPSVIDPVEIRPDILHFLRYHYTFFRAAMNADFLKSLIAGQITGNPDNIGHNPIFVDQPIEYDPLVNQETIPLWDSLITADPSRFYLRHRLLSPVSKVTSGHSVITPEKKVAFEKIAKIFLDNNTDYQIIISPNRRGIAISPTDLMTLRDIFGMDRVNDFSDSYALYLKEDTMLYDNTHYRRPFASKLMRAVYGSQ